MDTQVIEKALTPRRQYAAIRAQVGTQAVVAKLLGVTIKCLSTREAEAAPGKPDPGPGKPAIKPESFIAIQALADKKKKADFGPILDEAYTLATHAESDRQKLALADLVMSIQKALGKRKRDLLSPEERERISETLS